MGTGTGGKWELYDRLIEGIPADLRAEEILVCRSRTMVRSESGCGIAMTVDGEAFPSCMPERPVGKLLRDVAGLVKSWNYLDASVGLAAMNAWYNAKEHLEAVKARMSAAERVNLAARAVECPVGAAQAVQPTGGTAQAVQLTGGAAQAGLLTQTEDAFLCYQDLVRGKKVASVGHFAYLENRYAGLCELSILERDQRRGDYPDTAAEYLLEDQDYVFITGSTLINKTLPRLLQLCGSARVILCGPSTVMSEALFAWGVDDLAGFMVENADACREFISLDSASVFESGKMVRLVREECEQ